MNELLLISAFLLDIIFGDPELIFPHPIVLIGKTIDKLENFFIAFRNKRFSGMIFTLIVILITFFSVKIILSLITFFNHYIAFLLSAILGSFTISLRSLHLETKKVYNHIKNNDIILARKELQYLVSRDTNELEEKDIVRSVVETVSENLTDGVIAPLFYFAIGGIPLAFVYKAVNTLDSMIGYKNEKYCDFGWFAAKIDDVLNFIPARITGILVVVSSFILQYNWKNAFRIMLRDRKNLDSPNSGWSEAAVAGALNVRLGGPTPYFGVWHDKPYIGDDIEELSLHHILKSYKILYLTSILFVVILIVTS